MIYGEHKRRLDEVIFISGMNSRYHHVLEWWWGFLDKTIRVVVGILAVVGLILSVPGVDAPRAGLAIAIVSLVAAAILNIVPVGDWEKTNGEMFRLWSGLRKDAVLLENKTCDKDDDKDAYSAYCDHLLGLIQKMESLHALQHAPLKGLLLRCEGDENESRWGAGIRTEAQIKQRRAELQREETAQAATSASA
jgi:hypothetical protein